MVTSARRQKYQPEHAGESREVKLWLGQLLRVGIFLGIDSGLKSWKS
jgi:hypothetical protein